MKRILMYAFTHELSCCLTRSVSEVRLSQDSAECFVLDLLSPTLELQEGWDGVQLRPWGVFKVDCSIYLDGLLAHTEAESFFSAVPCTDNSASFPPVRVYCRYFLISPPYLLPPLVMLYYDHLLTLDVEIMFYWGRKRGFITSLFFFNRYVSLIGVLIYPIHNIAPLTNKVCQLSVYLNQQKYLTLFTTAVRTIEKE